MKTYEKPRLMALSLSGNEALCACGIDVVGDNVDPFLKEQMIDAGIWNGNRPIEEAFSSGEACKKKVDIFGYCKFGPSGESGGTVFNS